MASRDNMREEIRDAHKLETPGSGSKFWREFKSRAAGLSREEPGPVLAPGGLKVALACACLLLVVCAAYFVLPHRGGIGSEPVKSLEIDVPYESVVILHDADSPVTVLWVEES